MHVLSVSRSTYLDEISSAAVCTDAAAEFPAATTRLDLPNFELPTAASLARRRTNFAAEVRGLFAVAGIATPPDAVLYSDEQGAIRVANTHPQKDRIEQVLRGQPRLQQAFAKLSADSSLLRAFEGAARFDRAYEALAGNPKAQAALTYAEIARNNATFHLVVGEHAAMAVFGSVS